MKAIKQSLVMAGLFVALNFLYAPAQLSAQTIQSLGGVVTAQPDSVVQVVADSYNLAPVDPADLQVGGTYWWVEPGGAAVPMPCPPQQDANAVIYDITGDGQQFLVDCTGGEAQVTARRLGLQAQTTSSDVAAAVNAQADVIAALIDQIQTKAEDQQFQVLARAAGMADSDISFPGGGDGDGGTNSFSPNYSSYAAPDYGTNLWIAQWGMAAGKVTGVASNTLADVQYEIQTNSDLTTTNWVSTGQFILGSEVTNWTALIPIPVNLTQNCFFRLRSWLSSDGSGLPDWWELQNFGATGIDPNAQDAAGDGYTIYQKFQMGLNPNVFYTPAAPQGTIVNYGSASGTASISWLPSPGAVTGYTVMDSDGNTFNASATSSTLTVPYAPDFEWWNDGDPTMYKSYQIQAHYAGGSSALSASVPLQPATVYGSVVPAPSGNGNELVVGGIPAHAAAVRIFMYDTGLYYANNNQYNFTVVTNLDIPAGSFVNGTYVLPSGWQNVAQLPSLPLAAWSWQYYYLQSVDAQGNVSGGNFLTYGGDAGLGPDNFYDGRAQLKQNLIFQLRAAPVDKSFNFTLFTTNNGNYGFFGERSGAYSYPPGYTYAGLYPFDPLKSDSPLLDSLDPYLPFEENALFRNFVYNQADVDANGSLTTGAESGGDFVFLSDPVTHQFQTNGMALPSLLSTNDTRWLMYDGSVNCANLDYGQGTVSMTANVLNWFGLPFVSAMLAYANPDTGAFTTDVLAAGHSITLPGYDIYALDSSDIYYEAAQPQLQLVNYCFYHYLDDWFVNDALPGSTPFSPGSPTLIVRDDGTIYGTNNLPLIAGVGSSTQIAGYAKLKVANSAYTGVYAYLGQYFDKAYQIDDNGGVTTNQTGVLSPYGYYFATDAGAAALVTMPDPDTGARGTGVVNCISMNVDKNTDGNMDLTFNGPDATSQASPMRFWVNSGWDTQSGTDVPATGFTNCDDGMINWQRDLENFARLWLCGMPSLPASQGYTVTLSWQNVSGNPAVNLFLSCETNGGIGYLTDTNIAAAQTIFTLPNGSGLIFGQVPSGGSFTFPANFFTNNVNKYFLFEGAGIGSGQLTMTISQNGNTIAQTGVWLDLHDIKDFYERAAIANNTSGAISNWSSSIEMVQNQTTAISDEDSNIIVFVHGFNVDNWHWLDDSDTVFKRLYWAGYQGQFKSVSWPDKTLALGAVLTSGTGIFNDSEINAYKAGGALKSYLSQLKTRYPNCLLNIFAHSQGNAVASEAIKQGAPFDTYILTQGALPDSAYDVNAPTDHGLVGVENIYGPTPEWQPMGYRGAYTNFTGRIVNFYNTNDPVLKIWQNDQGSVKPNQPISDYTYNGTTVIYKPPFGSSYTVTDPQESRAYASRSRTLSIGQSPPETGHGVIQSGIDLHVRFGFDRAFPDDHSAQWTWPIQRTSGYYLQILTSLNP